MYRWLPRIWISFEAATYLRIVKGPQGQDFRDPKPVDPCCQKCSKELKGQAQDKEDHHCEEEFFGRSHTGKQCSLAH